MTQARALLKGEAAHQLDGDDYRARLDADLAIAERVHRSMIPTNQRREISKSRATSAP